MTTDTTIQSGLSVTEGLEDHVLCFTHPCVSDQLVLICRVHGLHFWIIPFDVILSQALHEHLCILHRLVPACNLQLGR